MIGRPPVPAEVRFLPKVDRRGPDECWPWKNSTSARGYGKFRGADGRLVGAHVFAHRLWKGPVDPGQVVMHSCDNPPCCNPAHLTATTQQVNIDDREAKGRGGRRGKPRSR